MKQMHTTYVYTMLFISIKTIDRHLQYEEGIKKHNYNMLDIKFYKEAYIIHIYICIFSTKLERNWYKCLRII